MSFLRQHIPELVHLKKVRWEIFGHLTFKFERVCARRRHDMFLAAIGRVCKRSRVDPKKLFYALREEVGSQRDRVPHFHFLIARLPRGHDLQQFCTDCVAEWRASGGGFSVVEPYLSHLNGVEYVAKSYCHDDDLGGLARVLTFSDALMKYLKCTLQ